MNTIDKIKAKLAKYPELTYQAEVDRISIDPPSDSGFPVWLAVNHPGFTVGFDGWHEEFDAEAEALDALAFGLSDHCRLKVTKRGETVCSWVVEWKEGDQWKEDSTTGLVLIPFWKSKSVEYRQNSVVKIGEQSPSGDDPKAAPEE